MTMKRLILVCVMILCLVPLGGWAEEASTEAPMSLVCGDYEYILLEDGTAEITSYLGDARDLVIPGVLDGYSVTRIGDGAFESPIREEWSFPTGISNLVNVTIPEGVISIGDNAFSLCSALQSITIPDTVTSIGDYVFFGCVNLRNITIPNSVVSVGANPIRYCWFGTTISVSPDHPALAIVDGVLYAKSDQRLILYPNTKHGTSFSIPDGIRIIDSYAFDNCSSLASVTIPDSVTNIASHAFDSCSRLESIAIPDGVTCIDDGTFFQCTALTRIVIPDSVTSIGNKAFNRCHNLVDVTIPDSVTEIGHFAFYNCLNLVDLILPGSVKSIGDGAFGGCNKLAMLMIPDSVIKIGALVFPKHPSLTIIVEAGSYAEQYCYENGVACITIYHSDGYWNDEWKNPQFPFNLEAYISNDEIPAFDSDVDAVRVGMSVIDVLHEHGQYTNETLFLIDHKAGEDLWKFCYAEQPLEPGFELCVVIDGRSGSFVSAWLGE